MAHITPRDRKNGTRSYVVKWRDPDGVFRERTFATKDEAKRWKSTVEKDLQDGGYRDNRLAKLTFSEVANEWLPTRSRKARTNTEYRRMLDARILPKFGERAVGSIKVADCVSFKNSLVADGLRPATITKVYGLFSTVLAYAVRRRYIIDNPASVVELPTNTSAEVAAFEGRYLTPVEFERLIEQVASFNPTYGLIVRLLGTTGMRVGELAGLNVGDVHILGTRGTATVRRTYDARYGLSESPKTSRSNRTLTLLPTVTPLLSAYLVHHPRIGDANAPLFMGRVSGGFYLGDWTQNGKPMFSSSKHARLEPSQEYRPFDPDKRFDATAFYKRIWRRAVSLVDLEPLRIHDLRHTAASLMLSSGMPIAMVSRQLGHSSTSTTDLIYGGLLRESFDSAVDAFGDWYEAQASTQAEKAAFRTITPIAGSLVQHGGAAISLG